jgi:hypothetical protein
MQHHHYVRAARQRRGVASLLVAAVTAVLVMPERLDPKLLGQFGGIVQTCIVYRAGVRRTSASASSRRYRREERRQFFYLKAFRVLV